MEEPYDTRVTCTVLKSSFWEIKKLTLTNFSLIQNFFPTENKIPLKLPFLGDSVALSPKADFWSGSKSKMHHYSGSTTFRELMSINVGGATLPIASPGIGNVFKSRHHLLDSTLKQTGSLDHLNQRHIRTSGEFLFLQFWRAILRFYQVLSQLSNRSNFIKSSYTAAGKTARNFFSLSSVSLFPSNESKPNDETEYIIPISNNQTHVFKAYGYFNTVNSRNDGFNFNTYQYQCFQNTISGEFVVNSNNTNPLSNKITGSYPNNFRRETLNIVINRNDLNSILPYTSYFQTQKTLSTSAEFQNFAVKQSERYSVYSRDSLQLSTGFLSPKGLQEVGSGTAILPPVSGKHKNTRPGEDYQNSHLKSAPAGVHNFMISSYLMEKRKKIREWPLLNKTGSPTADYYFRNRSRLKKIENDLLNNNHERLILTYKSVAVIGRNKHHRYLPQNLSRQSFELINSKPSFRSVWSLDKPPLNSKIETIIKKLLYETKELRVFDAKERMRNVETKLFNGVFKEFFNLDPLSQDLDETNGLSEIIHKRRISALGKGGVTSKNAPLSIRSIHPSFYGRLCPIDSPEGDRVGLINSLTNYARINSIGYIATPFYRTRQHDHIEPYANQKGSPLSLDIRKRDGRVFPPRETKNTAAKKFLLNVNPLLAKKSILQMRICPPIAFFGKISAGANLKSPSRHDIFPSLRLSFQDMTTYFDKINETIKWKNSPSISRSGQNNPKQIMLNIGSTQIERTSKYFMKSSYLGDYSMKSFWPRRARWWGISLLGKKSITGNPFIYKFKQNHFKSTKIHDFKESLEPMPSFGLTKTQQRGFTYSNFMALPRNLKQSPRRGGNNFSYTNPSFINNKDGSSVFGGHDISNKLELFLFYDTHYMTPPITHRESIINNAKDKNLGNVYTPFLTCYFDFISFQGYAPITAFQFFSPGVGLIPFLEHDDGTRALMGANMQRQAVPLISASRPIVGTGLEKNIAASFIISSSNSGYLYYISGKQSKQIFKGSQVASPFFKGRAAGYKMETRPPKHVKHVLEDAKKMVSAVEPIWIDKIPAGANKKPTIYTSDPWQKNVHAILKTFDNNKRMLEYKNCYLNSFYKPTVKREPEKNKNKFSSGTRWLLPTFLGKLTPGATPKLVISKKPCRDGLFNLSPFVYSSQRSHLTREVRAWVPCCGEDATRCGFAWSSTGLRSLRWDMVRDLSAPAGIKSLEKKESLSLFSRLKLKSRSRGANKIKQKPYHLTSRATNTECFKNPAGADHFILNTHWLPYRKSYKATIINKKPAIDSNSWLQKGDLLVDGTSSINGELALGENLFSIYMPWEGYNFEDAILISDKAAQSYTTIHVEEFSVKISKNEFVGSIVKPFTWVNLGDILVSKKRKLENEFIMNRLLFGMSGKPKIKNLDNDSFSDTASNYNFYGDKLVFTPRRGGEKKTASRFRDPTGVDKFYIFNQFIKETRPKWKKKSTYNLATFDHCDTTTSPQYLYMNELISRSCMVVSQILNRQPFSISIFKNMFSGRGKRIPKNGFLGILNLRRGGSFPAEEILPWSQFEIHRKDTFSFYPSFYDAKIKMLNWKAYTHENDPGFAPRSSSKKTAERHGRSPIQKQTTLFGFSNNSHSLISSDNKKIIFTGYYPSDSKKNPAGAPLFLPSRGRESDFKGYYPLQNLSQLRNPFYKATISNETSYLTKQDYTMDHRVNVNTVTSPSISQPRSSIAEKQQRVAPQAEFEDLRRGGSSLFRMNEKDPRRGGFLNASSSMGGALKKNDNFEIDTSYRTGESISGWVISVKSQSQLEQTHSKDSNLTPAIPKLSGFHPMVPESVERLAPSKISPYGDSENLRRGGHIRFVDSTTLKPDQTMYVSAPARSLKHETAENNPRKGENFNDLNTDLKTPRRSRSFKPFLGIYTGSIQKFLNLLSIFPKNVEFKSNWFSPYSRFYENDIKEWTQGVSDQTYSVRRKKIVFQSSFGPMRNKIGFPLPTSCNPLGKKIYSIDDLLHKSTFEAQCFAWGSFKKPNHINLEWLVNNSKIEFSGGAASLFLKETTMGKIVDSKSTILAFLKKFSFKAPFQINSKSKSSFFDVNNPYTLPILKTKLTVYGRSKNASPSNTSIESRRGGVFLSGETKNTSSKNVPFQVKQDDGSRLKELKNSRQRSGSDTIYIYVAVAKPLQVGDKMSGRHGNKGIISKILPFYDMPYLIDGTPIDIVLNPLGVPSRMNVGQIYESLLGLTGFYKQEYYRIPPFDENYSFQFSRNFVYWKLNELKDLHFFKSRQVTQPISNNTNTNALQGRTNSTLLSSRRATPFFNLQTISSPVFSLGKIENTAATLLNQNIQRRCLMKSWPLLEKNWRFFGKPYLLNCLQTTALKSLKNLNVTRGATPKFIGTKLLIKPYDTLENLCWPQKFKIGSLLNTGLTINWNTSLLWYPKSKSLNLSNPFVKPRRDGFSNIISTRGATFNNINSMMFTSKEKEFRPCKDFKSTQAKRWLLSKRVISNFLFLHQRVSRGCKTPAGAEKIQSQTTKNDHSGKLFINQQRPTVEKFGLNPYFPGKMRLLNGLTGETFYRPIIVGKSYMLKLIHLVHHKIHARATGPYALITQQPLKGKRNQGGQRMGEMEIWALYGFGSASILYEMLTIKSDDPVGRERILREIAGLKGNSSSNSHSKSGETSSSLSLRESTMFWKNEEYGLGSKVNDSLEKGISESFRVLVMNLRALCLDMQVFKDLPN